MRTNYAGCAKGRDAKRSYMVKVNDKGKQPLQQGMIQARLCVSSTERMPVLMDLMRALARNMSCVNGQERLYHREVM